MTPPRSVLMNVFFDQLFGFMKELSEMYPEDPDFPLGITTLRMMKSTNPAYIVSTFYDSLKGFEEQILSKNEDFFLSMETSDVDFNLLQKLKQYFSTMSAESKSGVWQYIQAMYKLTRAIQQ
jgi:hypothetical protein